MTAGRRSRLTRTATTLAATALAATTLATALAAGLASAAPAAARAQASHQVTQKANWKKGVGAWPVGDARGALRKSGASWYYTWSTNHSGIIAPHDVSFVPMVWGASDVTRSNLRQARRQSSVLLGFNEPNLPRQANMSVSQALALWPRLMRTGMRLGSPAVSVQAATPGSWLAQFMAAAEARHYRVNFITLHWYGGDFQTSAAVSQLKSYIQSVWQAYHKPIWLTEFALWRFNPTTFPSPQQQAAFVTAATRMLQGLRYVWRYAWFALPATDGDGTAGLFRPGARATAAGRAFEKVR
jgi:Glycosyl hydrolase catalytic core